MFCILKCSYYSALFLINPRSKLQVVRVSKNKTSSSCSVSSMCHRVAAPCSFWSAGLLLFSSTPFHCVYGALSVFRLCSVASVAPWTHESHSSAPVIVFCPSHPSSVPVRACVRALGALLSPLLTLHWVSAAVLYRLHLRRDSSSGTPCLLGNGGVISPFKIV